jgi:predicted Holliday junction resolvase-like endonuclease
VRKIARAVLFTGVNPEDIKVLFHPVEYVAFRGLGRNNCTSVEFLAYPPTSQERETIQTSIRRAIDAGNIEWQTLRIEDTGRVVCDGAKRFGI